MDARAKQASRAPRAWRGLGIRLAILGGVLSILYLGVCTWFWLTQDDLVFPGARHAGARRYHVPVGVTIERIERSRCRVALGQPTARPRGVLLFFLGNGEDLESGVRWASAWAGHGLLSVVPEYPGYGESPGQATVEAFYGAAVAAADRARRLARAAGVPLFVAGQSLGTFCAVHVVAQGFGSRLILAAPPTSVAAVAQWQYPLLPASWLLGHRFDNLARATELRVPTLVLHGDTDVIVPIDLGRSLATAISGARFVALPGVGHGVFGRFDTGARWAEIETLLFGEPR